MKRAVIALLACACAGSNVDPDAGSDAGVPDAGPPRNDAGASEVVAAHNAVRVRAMPAPMPALPAMSWHQGAADTAAAWVERCEYKHNTAIDGTYGENIYASYGSSPTPTQVVERWAAEAASYDYASDTCAVQECGHYTQIVWRQSTGVGCAWKSCQTGSPFPSGESPWLFWVCDYAPPGNFVGQRPY